MTEERDALSLPDVPDALVSRMEENIFDRIADERMREAAKTSRQRRTTLGWVGIAAAGAIVAAVAVPATLAQVQQPKTTVAATEPDIGFQSTDMAGAGDVASAESATADSATRMDAAVEGPAIVTSVMMEVRVDDVAATASTLAAYAESLGGFVESQSIGTDFAMSAEPQSGAGGESVPTPEQPVHGYVTVRIPSAQVSEAERVIGGYGTLVNTTTNRTDVTTAKIDLEARVQTLDAAVKRLREIMSGTGSVADLVAAEQALSDREATLESYKQQLEQLDQQVEMSSVNVTLTPQQSVVAEPGGFGTGISAGWDGLIASMNGVIVALGFALPWLGVLAVIVLVVWLLRRGSRARRTRIAPLNDEL